MSTDRAAGIAVEVFEVAADELPDMEITEITPCGQGVVAIGLSLGVAARAVHCHGSTSTGADPSCRL